MNGNITLREEQVIMTGCSFIFLFCSSSVSPSQRTAIMYSRTKVKSIIIVIMVILSTLSVTFLLISPHILQISRKFGSVSPM